MHRDIAEQVYDARSLIVSSCQEWDKAAHDKLNDIAHEYAAWRDTLFAHEWGFGAAAPLPGELFFW